jgi:hypothetical protein
MAGRRSPRRRWPTGPGAGAAVRPPVADDPSSDLLPLVTGLASAGEQRTSRKYRTHRRRVCQESLKLFAGEEKRPRRPPLLSASAGTRCRNVRASASLCCLQLLPARRILTGIIAGFSPGNFACTRKITSAVLFMSADE